MLKKLTMNVILCTTFTPLDIEATTKDTCEKYSPAISSTDLNTEMTKLLEKATEAVKSSPSYEASTQLTLEVKKSKDGYSLDDEQLQKLFSATMDNIMAPYDSVCEILDAQDYLTSCLNALFKSDVAEYAKHTGEDESSCPVSIRKFYVRSTGRAKCLIHRSL